MCPPLLFGTAAATAATSGTGAFVASTTGRLGSGGVFNLAAGSLTQNMGFGTLFNVLSSGTSLYGQSYQAGITQQNLEYQAQMQEYNRKVAENNAALSRADAEFEADTFDRRVRALMGTQQTRYAKSNVVINEDTPLDVAAETAEEAQLERLAIIYRGDMQAKAFEEQAKGNISAAARLRGNSEIARRSASINAFGTVAKAGYKQYRNTPGTSLLA